MSKSDQYLSPVQLDALGLGSYGRHVFISRAAVLTHPERVHIGSRVRIDAFALITGPGPVTIGNNVHLGTSVTISAAAAVTVGSFSGLSAGVKLFTTDDDYGGEYLTGPTVPPAYTNIKTSEIDIQQHCIVGANSVILPGTILEDGVAVGALSLVKGRLSAWGIYGGVPARLLKKRSKKLIDCANQEDLSFPST